ncbi:hypothetical protein [Streptomyces sp. NPDC058457]|uniref:hypothetical protein n=1 Tax=Streptomyces sp. NPDC058457 TaxID=3346507 RepID=UPI003652ABF5
MTDMPSETECPQCHHTFDTGAIRPVDPGVVRWLAEELTWSGQQPTERVYSDYLYSAGETPVSRQRFVQDLDYLGVPETQAPDGTRILTRS